MESLLKVNNLSAAFDVISEEKELLNERNKILKTADRHGWDTVKEYLDSPLAYNKDDANDLGSAIARTARSFMNTTQVLWAQFP